ncbi:MAG: fasciclin domain-containing protein [Actinobacteria bacterium]|nr:fasciclin domain-containing protein [Actinomycetota bacterium]
MAAALSLTLAACGSDSEGASDSSATTAASAEETSTTVAADETTEAPAIDAGTIVDIAAGNDDFSTLVAAVQAADLVDTLSGDGPFTVFAPTNEAFAALPDGTLDTLLMPENKDQLAGILTYHVVAGKVMAADLSDGQEVETVNGEMLTVGIDGEKVTLTDAAGNTVNVVDTDIEASNGVIHVIDGVVLPSA